MKAKVPLAAGKLPARRYAAKLLFQYRIGPRSSKRQRRSCEERIVLLTAPYAELALREAKRRGRKAQHHYRNIQGGMVYCEFIGVLELLGLEAACEPDEVWYETSSRMSPMERKAAILPKERRLRAILACD